MSYVCVCVCVHITHYTNPQAHSYSSYYESNLMDVYHFQAASETRVCHDIGARLGSLAYLACCGPTFPISWAELAVI